MREKADIWFIIYQQMGVDRTLTKLFEIAYAAGVNISLKTFERYSVKYEWQRKLLEQATTQRERLEQEVSKQVEDMNARHAQYSQALLGLFSAGIQGFQAVIRRKREAGESPTLDLSIQELTRLLETAQKVGRLARGLAISREKIKVELMNIIVQEFAVIFLSVTEIVTDKEQKEAMKQEYIRRFNELLRIYFPQAKERNYQIRDGQ